MRHRGNSPRNQQFNAVRTTIYTSETSAISQIAKKLFESKKVRVVVSFWTLGLVLGIFATGRTVTPEMKANYDHLLAKANRMEGYEELYDDVIHAENKVYDAKVWFWRFRPEHAKKVRQYQAKLAEAQDKLDQLNKKRDTIISQARHDVGLFSEYGLGEARATFWRAFDAGKVFAQRQTFWDTLFRIMASRDESVISFIIQWLFTVCLNFTLGLIGSLFYFAFSLASMVWFYQPDPLSAVTFYILAFLSAASIVAAYLVGIYGMAAGGVYVVGKTVLREARLQEERRSRLHGH